MRVTKRTLLLKKTVRDLEAWFESWYAGSWNLETCSSVEEIVEAKKIIERLKTIAKL